jgi:hypothetical protein
MTPPFICEWNSRGWVQGRLAKVHVDSDDYPRGPDDTPSGRSIAHGRIGSLSCGHLWPRQPTGLGGRWLWSPLSCRSALVLQWSRLFRCRYLLSGSGRGPDYGLSARRCCVSLTTSPMGRVYGPIACGTGQSQHLSQTSRIGLGGRPISDAQSLWRLVKPTSL